MDGICVACWRKNAIEAQRKLEALQAKVKKCLGVCPYKLDKMGLDEVFEKFPMTYLQQDMVGSAFEAGIQHISEILQSKGHLGDSPVLTEDD